MKLNKLFSFLGILLFFQLFNPSVSAADNILSWTAKAPLPVMQARVSSISVGDKVYVFGGQVELSNAVYIYDPSSNSWSQGAPMPTARYAFDVAADNNGKIYTIGGNAGYGALATNEVYNTHTNTWQTLASLPTPRNSLSVASDANGNIYAFGGLNQSSPSIALKKVEMYNPSTNTWTIKNVMPGEDERYEMRAVRASNGKIYLIGGVAWSPPASTIVSNKVEEYDPLNDTWTTKSSLGVARFLFGAALGNDGRIYVTGGTNNLYGDTPPNSVLASTESYNIDTNSWSSELNLPTPRFGFGFSATNNGKLYAIAGWASNLNSAISNIVEEATLATFIPLPTVDGGGPYNVFEGGSVQLSATGSDPSNSPLQYQWDLDNNGSFETLGQTVTFSATNIGGPASKLVTVQVINGNGFTATDKANVNVQNENPSIGTISAPNTLVLLNSSVSATANFTDPGFYDSHTALWDWGDGGTSVGDITENYGSGSVTGSHIYSTTGVYTITLSVTDNDSGIDTEVFQYVSVYNPTPQGLFTGNRIFTSPAGAYIQNPNLTGQVRFGVTSKYQGTDINGAVSMNFNQANLEFDSTTLVMLVTSNGFAALRGTGMINGSGSYNYLVTALDGGHQPGSDMIRIQIKDQSGEIVYDSQMNAPDTATPTTTVTGQVIVN